MNLLQLVDVVSTNIYRLFSASHFLRPTFSFSSQLHFRISHRLEVRHITIEHGNTKIIQYIFGIVR